METPASVISSHSRIITNSNTQGKKDLKTLLFGVCWYSASVLAQITSNSFKNCKKNRESLVS